MTKILLILLSIASLTSSFACINEYRTLLTGEVIQTFETRGKIWHDAIDTLELKTKAEGLLAAYERTDSIEYYSDYAACLTYLGAYEKAKATYQEIEELSPNRYTTASNLGTVYELMGQPDSALIWIKKSMQLNPESHKGSEWIHIKILEYKLSNTPDIQTSILGLDFGKGKIPSNPNGYDMEKLRTHIWHQLKERTTFVKPKNEIVGNIYFDLGNVLAQIRDVEAALESYGAAKEYGFESDLMKGRIIALAKLTIKANQRTNLIDFIKNNLRAIFWCILAGFIIIPILIIRFIHRRKKRNTTH